MTNNKNSGTIYGKKFLDKKVLEEKQAVYAVQQYLKLCLCNQKLLAKHSSHITKFYALPEESRKKISVFLYEQFSNTGSFSLDLLKVLVKNETMILNNTPDIKVKAEERKRVGTH